MSCEIDAKRVKEIQEEYAVGLIEAKKIARGETLRRAARSASTRSELRAVLLEIITDLYGVEPD